MMQLSEFRMSFKIAPRESLSIIGTSSIQTTGDLYMIDFSSVNNIANRRNKRLFDLGSSFLLLITYPFILIIVKNRLNGLINIFKVLSGSCSWVGYYPHSNMQNHNFPGIKKSIFTPADRLKKNNNISDDTIERLNLLYAKNYSILTDIRILLSGLKDIGRESFK
jgi:lipopolysaccharide/colanic/teichoic acid biosynthesis glycosyltransferase